MNTMNGNGGTTAPKTVSAASLKHRKLSSKTQLAAILAQIISGELGYKVSISDLAMIFGVSQGYIGAALGLSPEKRAAKAAGTDTASLSQLLTAPVRLFLFGPPTPAPVQSEPASNGSPATVSKSSAVVEPTVPATTQRVLTTRW